MENFKALRSASLSFSEASALLGENNSGKSAFLLAMELFFANSPRIKERDFSDGNIKSPINITIHFADLTPSEREEFDSNLLDGALVVTRRFSLANAQENGKYFVSARVNPEFSICRNETGKTEKRKLYADLREKYENPPELPKASNADEIDGFLEAWEAAHPDALKVEKVAGFRGWTNVAAGKLRNKTNFILIPAVQDAAEDIQQSKNSPVKTLIDTIARQTIENNAEFQTFVQSANEKMATLTDPKNVPILADISSGLTNILSTYYKNSEIIATWDPITEIQPGFPSSNLDVKDNEFVTGLDGVGHGLQRAVILTELQFMAEHRAKDEGPDTEFHEPQSDIIIAIEEPEIYQHPTKQRLFAKVLRNLAVGFNKKNGIRMQTIFVTHSPLLVSVTGLEGVRIIRTSVSDGKRNVSVKDIDIASCSMRCAELAGLKPEDAWSVAQFVAKLHTFDSEIAEGFFAKCVVLVEGVGDQSVLEAWYRLKHRDPHAEGIVIAKVEGKANLDKPIVIFQALGIPCYWVFDNDQSSKKDKAGSIKLNNILQRLGEVPAADCVEWPDCRSNLFAAWDCRFEKYVKTRVGEDVFLNHAAEASAKFDIDQDMCLKFPASATFLFERFCDLGAKFPEMDEIVVFVDALAAK